MVDALNRARRYQQAGVDWKALRSDIQKARDEQGIQPGKPGLVEFQRSRATDLERRYFGESGLFQSRLMYGIANADVDLGTLMKDLKASVDAAVQIGDGDKGADIRSTVVLGGGPAGLGAAIALAQRGIEVTLVERKSVEDRRFHPIFNSRISLLRNLALLGVHDAVMKESSYTEQAVLRNMVEGFEASLEPLHAAQSQGHLSGAALTELAKTGKAPTLVDDSDIFNLPDLISKPSRAQIAYGDLVHALAEHAKSVGVKIVDNATADVVPKKGGDCAVVAATEGGEKLDLGTPDRIVVASGRVDRFAALEGQFRPLEESVRRRFCSGLARIPMGSVQRRQTKEVDGETLRTVVIGHGQKDAAWMLTQVPESFQGGPEELKAYWQKEVASAMTPEAAAKLDDSTIEFVGDKPFDVQLSRLHRMSNDQQVLVIGDAAHKAHFLTSYGVHLAVGGDLRALEAHVDATRAHGSAAGFWEFERVMQENAASWCGGSLDEFDDSSSPWSMRIMTYEPLVRPGQFARRPLEEG